MRSSTVLLFAGLCLSGAFNLNDDGITQLPPTGEDTPQQDPSLKADQSFMAAQEVLKQAAAVPNPTPDDYGLEEAKQSAKAAAFSMEASEQSLGDSMLLGEAGLSFKKTHKNRHVDAMMGKLIMSDMFSGKELEHIKQALLSFSKPQKQVGESNKQTDPDHVALAKGLSVALQDKANAQARVHQVEEELARAKKALSTKNELNSASVKACQNQVAEMRAQADDTHKKILNANTQKLKAETQHRVSNRGFQMCDKAKKNLEAQVNSLKAEAMKQASKNVLTPAAAGASPCCQACAKLSNAEKSLLNADCSGCN